MATKLKILQRQLDQLRRKEMSKTDSKLNVVPEECLRLAWRIIEHVANNHNYLPDHIISWRGRDKKTGVMIVYFNVKMYGIYVLVYGRPLVIEIENFIPNESHYWVDRIEDINRASLEIAQLTISRKEKLVEAVGDLPI